MATHLSPGQRTEKRRDVYNSHFVCLKQNLFSLKFILLMEVLGELKYMQKTKQVLKCGYYEYLEK